MKFLRIEKFVLEPTATRPLAINIINGGIYFPTTDLTKNVCELVDAYGDIAAHYDYAPFGAVSAGTPSGTTVPANPLQWSSEVYDPELDLVYYNYRHYSPALGRFLSRDPIAEQGGWNLYAFVENAPILMEDILGMNEKCRYISQVLNGGYFGKNAIVGKPRNAVEGVSVSSAKGIGIGYFISTGVEIKREVCNVKCVSGGCGKKFKGSALFFVNIGLSSASHAFQADVTFRKGDWSVSGGVNAWVGIRTYGQVFGKGGGAVEFSTCSGKNSFVPGKINVGGEFGVEIGGEANAYLGFAWKGFGLRKRLGVGIAGGGRIGVLWDASVYCNKTMCDISGPIDFFAEAYMRAQLLGFNMEVGISGTTTLGSQTVRFANPLYSLLD